MRRNRAQIATFALLACLAGSGGTAGAAAVKPKSIPSGHGFPTPSATIQHWIVANDHAAMRRHAWQLWAGMTSPSGENGWPVWETWRDNAQVFFPASSILRAASRSRPRHVFVIPKEFIDGTGQDGPVFPFLIDDRYNPAAAHFITEPHPGPGGRSYHYNSAKSMTALNAAWPATATGAERGIQEFPADAIETKPIYSLVKAARPDAPVRLTPQPLWRGLAGATDKTYPAPATWTTCVLIDPRPTASGPLRPATAAEIAMAQPLPAGMLNCDRHKYLYAPLSSFYAFKLTKAEATRFNGQAHLSKPFMAQAGDYAVLVAMHVSTKETKLWTWQTFYWAPGNGRDGHRFPGSKTGQPAELSAPWNNYAMCANDNQTTTYRGKTMDVCFNPYLETGLKMTMGIRSNCMSCHGTARFGKDRSLPPDYKKPLLFFADPKYFNTTTTHTDFSWAIGFTGSP